MEAVLFGFQPHCGLFGLKPSRGRTPWGPEISEAMHGRCNMYCANQSVIVPHVDATQGPDQWRFSTSKVQLNAT
jgi:Asp-tRNA(Asn)/Glu-tRNA(Gln) amidotransferase A subunit family amidase